MSTGLLGFESVQERQGGVWEYLSPSRLNCWLSCPLKWKLRYLDGIRTPTTPALFVGKAVHAGLECYYRHRQLGVTLEADDVARRMVESWAQLVDEEKMDFDSTDDETAMRQQVADLVRVYLANVPKDEKPLAVEVAAEAPLVDPDTGEDLGMPLVGVIDLVLDNEAGPLITDFKTAARSSEPMEISNEIQFRAMRGFTGRSPVSRRAGWRSSPHQDQDAQGGVPPLRGPHGCPFPTAVRRDPRVSRRPRRRTVQLPAGLRLRHVRFPEWSLPGLGSGRATVCDQETAATGGNEPV